MQKSGKATRLFLVLFKMDLLKSRLLYYNELFQWSRASLILFVLLCERVRVVCAKDPPGAVALFSE